MSKKILILLIMMAFPRLPKTYWFFYLKKTGNMDIPVIRITHSPIQGGVTRSPLCI